MVVEAVHSAITMSRVCPADGGISKWIFEADLRRICPLELLAEQAD